MINRLFTAAVEWLYQYGARRRADRSRHWNTVVLPALTIAACAVIIAVAGATLTHHDFGLVAVGATLGAALQSAAIILLVNRPKPRKEES